MVKITTVSVPKAIYGAKPIAVRRPPPVTASWMIPPTDPNRNIRKNARKAARNPIHPDAPPTRPARRTSPKPMPLRVGEMNEEQGHEPDRGTDRSVPERFPPVVHRCGQNEKRGRDERRRINDPVRHDVALHVDHRYGHESDPDDRIRGESHGGAESDRKTGKHGSG